MLLSNSFFRNPIFSDQFLFPLKVQKSGFHCILFASFLEHLTNRYSTIENTRSHCERAQSSLSTRVLKKYTTTLFLKTE